jgi:glycosyltransferase involved in cell wall biosynthesis
MKKTIQRLLKNSSIVLATHYQIYSASQALRDYFRQRGCKRLLYISHPLGLADANNNDRSCAEISSGKKILQKKMTAIWFDHFFLRMLFEMVMTIWRVISSGMKYDFYIGVDNFNALHGLFLKRLGRVKKVVYYTIDYFPRRFESSVLNTIYHAIDKFCVAHADETWNVGKHMPKARKKHNNMDPKDYPNQHYVPIGIWYNNAPRLPFSKINKHKLIFVGHLVPHMGVDLVVRALPAIKAKLPNIELHIMGGGQELEPLKKLAKKLRASRSVTFYGWIRDRSRLEKLMANGAVGLATFNTSILDDKVKNADPGKIKDYMLLGMPVIVTDAIATADEIMKSNSGIVINYQADDLVKAVVQLVSDERRLERYRKNALQYVKQFDFPKLYTPHVERILTT